MMLKKQLHYGAAALLSVLAISCAEPIATPPPAVADTTEVAESYQAMVSADLATRISSANIYEVNLRQYSKEGTLAAFETQLPRLRKMGVDILWFMPIHPIGEKNRKGTLGSYYAVKDFRAINPDHGTLQEFKAFVEKAHSMGFMVILDWVANHTAWDNALLTEHPDWFTKDAQGNFQPPVADWSDVVDLNYDNAELRKYMIGSMAFWVREANIDGFRCDVAEMVPLDFWETATAELNKLRPVFMLAEGQDTKLHSAFQATYSWDFHHLMNGIAKGEKMPADIDAFIKKEAAELPEGAFRMHFITNHDENSWNGTVRERLGDGADAFAALAFTMPGMPLIYSGQESALDKRLDFFEKDVIEWGNYPKAAFYQKLLQLKHDHPSLWNGAEGGSFIHVDMENEHVYGFARMKGKDQVVVVVNLSAEAQHARMLGTDVRGGFTDVFADENKILSRGTPFDLAPWEYKIFTFGMKKEA